MKTRRLKYLVWQFLGINVSLVVFASQTPNNKPPEQRVDYTLTRLQKLHTVLISISSLSQPLRDKQDKFMSQLAFQNGVDFFNKKEFSSAAREFQYYLNSSYIPKKHQYLQAQKYMGEIYFSLGQFRTAQTFFHNYLNAFLTSEMPNYDQFIAVLKKMIKAMRSADHHENKQLKKLLAIIANIDFPEEFRDEIRYIAAKTAFEVGLPTARQWLDNFTHYSPDIKLNSHALYYRALLELRKGNYLRAQEILRLGQRQSQNLSKDLTNKYSLLLARIATQQRKYDEALKLYESVEKNDQSYLSAKYETIFTLLSLQEYRKARSQAVMFLSEFSNTAQSKHIQGLLPYFHLLANDLESAQNSIESSDHLWEEMKKKLKRAAQQSAMFDMYQLSDIVQWTDAKMEHPPIVKKAMSTRLAINELEQRLHFIHSEVLDASEAMSRSQLHLLLPSLKNQLNQFYQRTVENLQLAQELVLVEKYLYRPYLNKTDDMKWQSSINRRQKMLEKFPKEFHENPSVRMSQYLKLMNLLEEINGKNQENRARLSALKYHVQMKKTSDYAMELKKYEQKIKQQNKLIMKYSQKVENFKKNSVQDNNPLSELQHKLTDYRKKIKQEIQLSNHYRQGSLSSLNKLLFADLDKAWLIWDHNTSILIDNLQKIDQRAKSLINRLYQQLQAQEKDVKKIQQTINTLKQKLNRTLARSKNFIFNHYHSLIDQRLSHNKKWLADLKWEKMEEYQAKKDQFLRVSQLEKQLLNEKYIDLKQGVIQEWPD